MFCGRYGFWLWPILLWLIWLVVDVVVPPWEEGSKPPSHQLGALGSTVNSRSGIYGRAWPPEGILISIYSVWSLPS